VDFAFEQTPAGGAGETVHHGVLGGIGMVESCGHGVRWRRDGALPSHFSHRHRSACGARIGGGGGGGGGGERVREILKS
jgi:hypothetical protein